MKINHNITLVILSAILLYISFNYITIMVMILSIINFAVYMYQKKKKK